MATKTENGRALVLAADDDQDILDLLAFCLRGEYEVVTAANGEDALRQAADRRPDLVLLDVRMPGLDGIEVLRAIRDVASTRGTPVILISASVQEASIARGFEAGADDYLKKPFTPDELLVRIRAKLGSRRSQADSGVPRPQEGGVGLDRAPVFS